MSSGGVGAGDLEREDVLDVDHADDAVEALLVDRQPAVPGLGEGRDQALEADRRGHGDDVAARHRDVGRPCSRRNGAGCGASARSIGERSPTRRRLALVALDRLLDLVAERRFAVVAEQQGAQAAPEAASVSRPLDCRRP